jgi:hypothetical protein
VSRGNKTSKGNGKKKIQTSKSDDHIQYCEKITDNIQHYYIISLSVDQLIT